MRITPLDVRKQEFRRAVRGFDCEEVRAFLTTVADEYEAVLIDNKQLRERILEQDQKIIEYRDMEKALRDTLMTAERVMTEAKENAAKKGDLIIEQAGVTAQQVIDRARQRAEEMRRELIALHKEKEAYLTRFRSLAEAQVQFVENHTRDFKEIDTRVLDAAETQIQRSTQPAETEFEKPEITRDIGKDRGSAADDDEDEMPWKRIGTTAEADASPDDGETEVRARESEPDIWRDYSPGAMLAKPRQPEPKPRSPESAAGKPPRAAAAKGGEIPEFPIPPVDAIPGQRFQFSPRPSPVEGTARAEIPVEETRPHQG